MSLNILLSQSASFNVFDNILRLSIDHSLYDLLLSANVSIALSLRVIRQPEYRPSFLFALYSNWPDRHHSIDRIRFDPVGVQQ